MNTAGDLLQRKILKAAVDGDLLWRLPAGAMEYLFIADLPPGSPRSPRAQLGALLDGFARDAARGEHPGVETMDELVRRTGLDWIPEARLALEAEWTLVRATSVPDARWVAGEAIQWHRRQRLGEAILRASALVGPDAFNRSAYEESVALLRRAIQQGAGADDPAEPNGPVLVNLATVVPREIEILDPDAEVRLVVGKLALLVGDPGLGKSLVTLEVAARQSRHGQRTLILSAEDAADDTIRPRFDRFGGDPRYLDLLQAIRFGDKEREFDLETDLDVLDAALERTGARLLIIDPISAYFGRRNSWKDTEVRRVLAPVTKLLERRRVAGIAVAHLNKSSDRPALYRVLGSIGFVATARLVYTMAVDRNDPSDRPRRLLSCPKFNNEALRPTLGFRITPQVTIKWEGQVDGVDADAALSAPPNAEARTARVEALEFLRQELADGREVPVAALKSAAAKIGISYSALWWAKRHLSVGHRHQGVLGQDGGGEWLWRLIKGSNIHSSDEVNVAAPAGVETRGNTGSEAIFTKQDSLAVSDGGESCFSRDAFEGRKRHVEEFYRHLLARPVDPDTLMPLDSDEASAPPARINLDRQVEAFYRSLPIGEQDYFPGSPVIPSAPAAPPLARRPRPAPPGASWGRS